MLQNLWFAFLMLITVVLNTTAQVLLKLGTDQHLINIYLLGGITAYGISTVFYIIVLGKFNLSIAYPIIIGLTVIATTIAGALFLREKVNTLHWMGTGLILSGLLTITLNKISP
jgi:multidrug transporter EmrE-like cation transporter